MKFFPIRKMYIRPTVSKRLNALLWWISMKMFLFLWWIEEMIHCSSAIKIVKSKRQSTHICALCIHSTFCQFSANSLPLFASLWINEFRWIFSLSLREWPQLVRIVKYYSNWLDYSSVVQPEDKSSCDLNSFVMWRD